MRNLLLLILSLIGLVSQLFAQNPYWAFPPYYVDFNNGGSVNTLGGGTITKNGIANAIFSQSGVLQLYATKAPSQVKFYNRSDQFITGLSTSYNGPNDLAFIPMPGVYNTYLVPRVDFLGSLGNNLYAIFLSQVSFNGNSGACISSFNSASGFQTGSMGMAAPITPDLNSSTATPYLYVVGNTVISGQALKVNIYYVQSGSYYVTGFSGQINSSTSPLDILETEISHDGNNLAFCIRGDNNIYIFNNIKACAGGSCTVAGITTKTITSATAINGIEFSPDGSNIFYTKSTSTSGNQIGYINLSTNVQTDVTNSTGLGSSYIEYAPDGFMYVSSSNQLSGFSISNTPYSIIKTISGITNSALNGIYTLPDQIDGADYTSLEGCQSGSATFTTSPIVSTKVSGSITASGTAQVNSGANVVFRAGTSVILQSGFKALNGSTFRAKTESCTFTSAAVTCTSNVYRKASEDEEYLLSKVQTGKAFPNPVSGLLNFGSTVSSYSLSNGTGYEILKGNNSDKIDVTNLPKGMYMLKLDDRTEKIIIQ